jgi:hypothetical protein
MVRRTETGLGAPGKKNVGNHPKPFNERLDKLTHE